MESVEGGETTDAISDVSKTCICDIITASEWNSDIHI